MSPGHMYIVPTIPPMNTDIIQLHHWRNYALLNICGHNFHEILGGLEIKSLSTRVYGSPFMSLLCQ